MLTAAIRASPYSYRIPVRVYVTQAKAGNKSNPPPAQPAHGCRMAADAWSRYPVVSGEPKRGASPRRLPSSPRDFVGLFLQVEGSPIDSRRPGRTVRNYLTRKRSLVQIQYGPPAHMEFLQGETTARASAAGFMRCCHDLITRSWASGAR
jgi:hypothetical protein